MDYSPCPKREIGPFLKGSNISETGETTPNQNWCACTWCRSLLAWFFWADSDQFNFLMTMDVHAPKGKFGRFWKVAISPKPRDHAHQNWCTYTWHWPLLAWIFWADSDRLNISTFMDHKLILSPKPERPHPPKLVCMHLTSIPTCINVLSRFRSIDFLMTMDYSPCPEREIWPFFKGSNISETGETTPIKTGVHALDIHPYLHKFFELIPINWIFWWPWTIVRAPKGKFGCFWKVVISPKLEKLHPPKLVCMHLISIPTCMIFLSQFRSIKFFHFYGP